MEQAEPPARKWEVTYVTPDGPAKWTGLAAHLDADQGFLRLSINREEEVTMPDGTTEKATLFLTVAAFSHWLSCIEVLDYPGD